MVTLERLIHKGSAKGADLESEGGIRTGRWDTVDLALPAPDWLISSSSKRSPAYSNPLLVILSLNSVHIKTVP